MPRTLRVTGESKNLTFEELREFVKAAGDAGVGDDECVTAEVSTTGKIKELEVEIP
ncbi:hypothetical protein [Streptomyces sp. NPDC006510]|uniref:hypothetical protein n=1 Tax=Streptomyces sp. NPDC006510 TaxID=3155600 RepID=UPI0033ABAEAA